MARAVPIWLSFLVPLICIGSAHGQDILPTNDERPQAIEPQHNDTSGANSTATAGAPHPAEITETSTIIDSQGLFVPKSIETARAQYLPPNAVDRPVILAPQYAAVSSYFDADSLGNRTAYVDSTFAPFGIYESGGRLRLTGNASWYRFVTNEDPRTLGSGRYLEGALLLGYSFWLPGSSFTWLVGPAFAESVNEGVITDRWGVKAMIEMTAKPTELTMASGSVSYSTVANNLQAQVKAGIKIFGDVYFGPEAKFKWQQILPWQVNFSSGAIATTTPVSPQTNIALIRVGAHLSAVSVGPVLFGISGGWAEDRQLGSGYYGSVSLYLPF
jgi:hypothetical protein